MELQHWLLLAAAVSGALTLAFAHVPTWNALVAEARNLIASLRRLRVAVSEYRTVSRELDEATQAGTLAVPECRHSWMGAVKALPAGADIRLHHTPCTDPVMLKRPGLVVDMFVVPAFIRTDEVRASALSQGMCQHCVDELLPAGCYVFDKDEMLKRCTDVMRQAYKGAAA